MDERLARLISHIHHTSEFRQCFYVGNTVQQCRIGLFQDSEFANSKSTSVGLLCVFGSQTCVPICRMCKTQTSVSHSSTEAELIVSWCRFTHGWNTSSWSLGFGFWSLSLLSNSIKENQRSSTRKLVAWYHIKQAHPKTKLTTQPSMTILSWLSFVEREVFFFFVRCSTFLRTMKPWSRWHQKAEVPQWDTYQEPTELLWVGFWQNWSGPQDSD